MMKNAPKSLRERYGLDRARPRGLLGRFLAFLLEHAGAVFAAMMLLTVVAGYLASKLPLVTDFAALIPQDSRSVRDLHAGERYLGNTSLLVVLIDAHPAPGEDAAHAGERARKAAEELTARLRTDPEFPGVTHRFEREFFEKNALLYLTVEQLEDLHGRLDRRITAEILAENPLFVDLDDEPDPAAAEPDIFDPETLKKLYGGKERDLELREYLVDDSGLTYLVLVQPRKPAVDMAYNRGVLDRVESHVTELGVRERLGVSVSLAGNYRSAIEENDSVRRDLNMAGAVAGGLLLVVILLYFRRVRATWIIFVPLISGVVIMMGYVKLAVGHLNTITGFCFALFMGLAIDLAIHMLARYDEERARGLSVFDALLATYRETGRASLAAGATTAVGFAALTVAEFKGLQEFGVIAGGGIIICLAVIAIELPAVIALSLRFARERRFVALGLERALSTRRPQRYRAVTAIGIVALAFLGERALHVGWEGDFRNLRGGPAETLELANRFHAILGRSTQPAVRIAGSVDEAAALAGACNAERERRGSASTVQMCLSLADFIPADQPARLAIIERIKALVTDERLAALDDHERKKLTELRDGAPTRPLTEADLPAEIRQSFVSPAGDAYFMKAYPAVETWLIENNVHFADELMAIDDASATDIGPIGTAMIMADLMRIMSRDSVLVVAVALLSVFLVLLVISRSFVRALSCYVPLMVGLVFTGGLMVLMDMKLGFFNMIVLPSLIGIGVDNNIHLLHRYHVEGRGSWRFVVHTTGSACAMAAITTMAGFAGLLLAGHMGLRTIGSLAILGMTVCTLVSITLLPAAGMWLEARFEGRKVGFLPSHRFTGPPTRQ